MYSPEFEKKISLSAGKKILSVIIRNIFFIIIQFVILFSGCSDNIIDGDMPEDPIVKIVSPVSNSNFFKHEQIYFKAYLMSGDDTLSYDNIEWHITGYDYNIGYDEFERAVNVGKHEVTCMIFKDNKSYFSKVEFTVDNNVLIDTVFQNDQFMIYQVPNDYVNCLAVDIDDNILVGTKNTGLYINQNNTWNNFDKTNGLISNCVQTITVSQNNEIYFGYYFDVGLSILTGNGLTNIDMDPHGGSVQSILFDKNNILWVATLYGSINKYNDGNWIIFPKKDVDFHHPAKILFDSKNNLWGASNYSSLKYDGQTWDSVFVDGKVVRALSMVIDKNDDVWFGCEEQGLIKFSETDTVIYNVSNSGLPSNIIYSLALDSKNNLWIGTDNGLVKFDGTNWELIDLTVSGKRISKLAVDSNDKVWFNNSDYPSQRAVFGSYISN